MPKKYIRHAFIFLSITMLIFGGTWWYQQHISQGQMRGQFAFEQTRNNIRQLTKIQITTPQSGQINIYRKNGDWFFKEAKDYFVNVHQLADFYNMVNNSLIESVYPAHSAEMKNKHLTTENGTEITTYNAAGNMLDKVIIGKHSKGASSYAYSPKNKNYYYVISDVGSFSGEAADWVPYPLLTIEEQLLKSLKTEHITLDNRQIQQLAAANPAMRRVLEVLSFISYDGISAKSALLSKEAQSIKPHKIELTMVGGLIYVFEIYKIEDLYWLSITLKADKITRREVPSFVANNQKYFADWLFLMNTRQGKTLYEMQ